MSRNGFFVLLFAASNLISCTKPHRHFDPHLDLEASSLEIRARLTQEQIAEVPSLKPVIDMGDRNFAWIAHINSKLPAGQPKLSFSNKDNMTSAPVDKPSIYSEKIVLAAFDKLNAEMPREMFAVIIRGAPFTDTTPIATEEYLKWAKDIDRVYAKAQRWIFMQEYLPYLEGRRRADVRGLLNLQKESDLQTKLQNFAQLDRAEQTKLGDWLTQICWNANIWNNNADCKSWFAIAAKQRTLQNFYALWSVKAKAQYDSYFRANSFTHGRPTWTSADPKKMTIEMVRPANDEVTSYIKQNVEEEWTWGDWKLEILFDPSSTVRVIFKPGELPHVRGSEIVMDENSPLTEWDAQWTIRHEFGHVIGFPDCYLEFYVSERNEIVNYQLDVENLMCSRRGRLQQKHFDELKRIHYRN